MQHFFMQLFCGGASGFWVIFGLPGPFWVHLVVDCDISNHLASDLPQTSPPKVPWNPIYDHKTTQERRLKKVRRETIKKIVSGRKP